MPSKKPPRQPEPPWQAVLERLDSHSVLLEDMRSQNRLTIEAVEATRMALEQRIDRLERETSARDVVLEAGLRDVKLEVRQLQGDVKVLQGDVRTLQGD